LEHLNLSVSSIQQTHQSKQSAIDQRNTPYGQELDRKDLQRKQQTDQKMIELAEGLRREEPELEKAQKNILPKANEVADTILRKYQKARSRGQYTDLPPSVEPLTVKQNESKKFVTTSFINGLKLFDSDKSGRNQLSWTLNDSGRNLQPNRCA
jgi:hypothetical protein